MSGVCEVCEAVATGEVITYLFDALGPLDQQADLVATVFGGHRGVASGERIDATLCGRHYASAMEGICDAEGSSSGRSLTPRTCQDAFHYGESDGIPYTIDGSTLDWTATGYECPTCGFKTVTVY